MTHEQNRRRFMQVTAAAGAGFWAAGGVSPKRSVAALEEVRFACVGIGGKGSSDSADAKKNGNVVAICDIDEKTLNKSKDKFDGAKTFFDYRTMLKEMGKEIDAVTVSTPDHNHAGAAIMAMKMGKHCFCQKPMTHSIYEARLMGELARDKKLITQMGNQGTAQSCLRKCAELIKAGAIGEVKEVHVWTNRPVWPQGSSAKPEYGDAPEHVHWPEWIGPAKNREYSAQIHPFKWRGYWDFGTGALGDMACHTLNMSFAALNLKNPTSVAAKSSGHDKNTYPGWSEIVFEFPEMEGRAPVKMVWYDGTKKPPAEALKGMPSNPSSGALVIGTEGKLFSPGDYGGDEKNSGILKDGEFTNWRRAKVNGESVPYTRSPGHFVEFAEGIKNNTQPMSNFPDYAGPLTETILLGNLAVWKSGETIKWDAENLKVLGDHADDPELKEIVKHTYHNDYEL